MKPPAFTANQAPLIKGVRSRVVNAKRSTLSKRVRHQVEKDNTSCSSLSLVSNNKNNLRGWDSVDFNPEDRSTDKHLVRVFAGHTRFATSSKASFDGTHPHLWSPRRCYTFYPFMSATGSVAAAKQGGKIVAQTIGVENYVTHNGTSP